MYIVWYTWRGPGDDDVILPLRQPKLQTVCLHSFRFQVRRDGRIIDILRSSQSSRILSSHFFSGFLRDRTDRCPCVWSWNSIFGNLSLPIQFTCPKYVNVRAFKKSMMSFSINNFFIMSTFILLSFLVIPLIFLSTDISNTLMFFLWCSFRVHISELYSMIDWRSVLYSRTFVGLPISSAFHIWCRLLTMPDATPILLSTSLSHDASWMIFPPKYTNS